jgi:hypothetical protein
MGFQRHSSATILSLLCIVTSSHPACAELANSEKLPKQILRTGVNLNSSDVSPNTRQLAENLKLTALLERLQTLRPKINPIDFEPTLENIALSQQITACTSEATQIIQEANLSADFTLAEINAEQNIYNEMLSTMAGDRDKAVLKTNAISFILNGALWSICEGLDIPTYRYPKLAIPSGATGILAGIVPSIASMYALRQLNGKQETSEREPNMLAKIFNYPVTAEIEYPKSVWDFLSEPETGSKSGKSRRDLLIERWVTDNNIPAFTDRASSKFLDALTATKPQKKGLNITTLNTRLAMLQQLGAEVLKMKRLLLELAMVVHGEKHI